MVYYNLFLWLRLKINITKDIREIIEKTATFLMSLFIAEVTMAASAITVTASHVYSMIIRNLLFIFKIYDSISVPDFPF